MKFTIKQQGFTIVETLVAITILMIAIAGPLSIASKGLTAAITSRNQMIASYLAQESIEVLKNIRDNNVESGGTSAWINGFSGCLVSTPCDASTIDLSTIATGGSTYPLKLTSAFNYSHGSTGSVTPFSRKFYLAAGTGGPTCQISDSECLVIVKVSWNEGITPYEVSLSNQLLSAQR